MLISLLCGSTWEHWYYPAHNRKVGKYTKGVFEAPYRTLVILIGFEWYQELARVDDLHFWRMCWSGWILSMELVVDFETGILISQLYFYFCFLVANVSKKWSYKPAKSCNNVMDLYVFIVPHWVEGEYTCEQPNNSWPIHFLLPATIPIADTLDLSRNPVISFCALFT